MQKSENRPNPNIPKCNCG